MAPEPRGMGEFSRIMGVFLEPTKAFADIARRPSWFVPLLLTILAGVAYYTAFGQHVTWQRFLQHQMDTNPKVAERMAQIPPEQRASSMAMQAKFAGIGYDVAIVIFTPLALLISAAIVMGIANAIGAGIKFKQVFAVMAYAGLPIIIKHALSIVVMFLKNPDDFNLINPLAFNPAAFMDPVTSSKFLYTLATALDVFAIWILLLGATGLKAAAGKRLTFGGALFAVATPFVLFTLFGATMAGMFS
jgi:hypothetical protein